VTLPYQRVDHDPSEIASPAKSTIAQTQDVLKDVAVLLVDDSEDNRRYIAHVLSKRGARITQARDGKEAVDTAQAQNFDVILMDVQMPVLDGNEATRALRANGNRTPIIALTAHAMLEEKDRSLKAGANAHVTKPVDVEILVSTILDLV
jgi:CheY-like chemotaxis protein